MLGNGFTRKKVGSLTLGEKLKKIRAEYRVNLAEVARETGIRKEHLEYLENGEYVKLPADVYIRGFLRSYARFLGVDSQALIRLYERERSIAKNLGKEPEKEVPAVTRRSSRFTTFVVTPRMTIGIVAGICVFGIAFYLYREFQTFVSEPYLAIFEPTDGQVVNADEAFVVGKTDRDAKLFLNNEPLFVDESGAFRERIRLQSGVNTATVRVVNRFGKERMETVSVVADFVVPERVSELALPDAEKGRLILSAREKNPVSILVRSEGKDLYLGELSPGEPREFDCAGGCAVDSTSGAGTLASWEGDEAKPLGEVPGKVIGVPFPPSPEQGE